MTNVDDDTPLPLDEAARRMFPMGGVTAITLKAQVRKGHLKAYRIGKAYHTTLRDMREMVRLAEVKTAAAPVRKPDADLASKALDAALGKLRKPK